MPAIYEPAKTESDLSNRQNLETPVRRMLSVREAAAYLGVSESYLNKSRITGDGPPYHKIGRRVLYAPYDLDTHLEERKRHSTSELAVNESR